MEELIEQEFNENVKDIEAEYDYAKGEMIEAEAQYLANKKVIDEYTEKNKEVKSIILKKLEEGVEPTLVEVRHTNRKGKVDMAVLQRKFNLMDGDIDACRKPGYSVDAIYDINKGK